MASKSAAIVVPIVGDASRLSKGLSDAQTRIQNFGIAATAALTAFAYKSVQAYREREAAQNKLNVSLSKSPALYNLTASALEGYNQALAEKTAIDDDVIAGAEAILARFAESEDQLKRLTELALDYSAATGKELTDSATAVGKAMLGQTRALKSLGINYTLTGDKAADAARILDLLEGKVSGTAEAFAQTSEGRIMEFQRQLGELQETIGAGLMPPLLAVTEAASSIFELFGKLPKPVQQVGFAFALAGAAAMALGPRILAAKAAMAQIQMQAEKTQKPVGLFTRAIGSSASVIPVIGAALAVGVTAFSLFAQSNDEAEQANRDFATQLDFTTNALNANNAQLALTELRNRGLIDTGNELGLSQQEMIEAVLKGGPAWDAVAEKLDAYSLAVRKLGPGAYDVTAVKAADLKRELEGLAQSTADQRENSDESAVAMKDNATAAEDNKAALDDLSRSVDKLSQAWERFVGVSVDARQAELDRMAASRDLIKLTKNEGASTADLAEKIYASLDAIEAEREAKVKNGDSTRSATKFAYDQVKALLATARQAGASKKEIDNLKLALQQLRAGGGASIPIQVTGASGVGGGKDTVRATGGIVLGPGTGTSDSIPAWLSNGEYVVQASAVAKYGLGFMNRLNAKRLASGGSASHSSMLDRTEAKFDRLVDKLIGRLEKKLDEAVQHLKDIRGKMSELSGSLVDAVKGGTSLSNISTPDGMVVSSQSIRAGAQALAAKARLFISKIKQLAKIGLSRPLLSQIIGMGPDGGLEYASALLEGGKSLIKDVNALDRQTTKLAGKAGDYLGRSYYGDAKRDAQRDVKRARRDLRNMKQAVRDVHIEVHGHVLTEKQLIKLVRDELKKDDKRNGRG